MATLIHAIGKRPNLVYRVYGAWGERKFPNIRSRSALYSLLADELGLGPNAARKDVVFALMDKSWDDSKWTDDFRVNLKSSREAKGLTQSALAECTGLSLDGIRALEQGLRRPNGDTLRRLAAVLETSVDELLGVPSIDSGSETHEVLLERVSKN